MIHWMQQKHLVKLNNKALDIAWRLRQRSPWLANNIIGFASGFLSAQKLHLGIKIHSLSEERVTVDIQDEATISMTKLVAGLELALNSFWEQHLPGNLSTVSVSSLSVELNQELESRVRLDLFLPHSEREPLEFSCLQRGIAEEQLSMPIMNAESLSLGSIQVKFLLHGPKALGGR